MAGEVDAPSRKRILAGDHSALKFDTNPELAVGETIVLLQSKEQRHVADREAGEVIAVPPKPIFWIEVSHPPFLKEGKWVVRFHVYDLREDERYLAPSGGYTSSPHRSPDKDQGQALQAVDDDTLERFARENRERFDSGRPADIEAEKARRFLDSLSKIQREAAKLGVTITPDLEAAFEAAKEKVVERRKAA